MFTLQIRKNLSLLFLFIFTLSASVTSYATTHTWLGGTGDWHKGSNWDTGMLPENGDHVIIPSGTVNIVEPNAKCSSIVIHNSATLLITAGNNLNINTGTSLDGIVNQGKLTADGDLELYGYYNGPLTNTNRGIYNEGTFTLKGNTIISGYNREAIRNAPGAIGNLNGTIDISNSGSHNIRNEGYFTVKNTAVVNINNGIRPGIKNEQTGTFTNDGNIDISNLNIFGSSVISSSGLFINNASGFIYVHDNITSASGLTVWQSTGFFKNKGALHFENMNCGNHVVSINSNSRFYNYNTGELSVANTTTSGISLTSNADFRNLGDVNIDNVGWSGISVEASSFRNYGSGQVHCTNTGYYGIRVLPAGEYRNYGLTEVYDVLTDAIWINHLFSNRKTGKVITNGRIRITTTNGLVNHGHFMSSLNYPHIGSSQSILNEGVLGDEYGFLQTLTNANNSVIVNPFQGTVQINVPVQNALNLGSLNYVEVEQWTITPNGNIAAGTYNPNNNTFTPNENAKGLSDIYVTIKINNTTGNNRYTYRVSVPGGIQGFSGGGSGSFAATGHTDKMEQAEHRANNNTSTIQFKTYPNPTSDFIFVETSSDTPLLIQLTNQLGQTVLQQEVATGINKTSMALPNTLGNGTYLLSVWDNGQLLKKERVIVVK